MSDGSGPGGDSCIVEAARLIMRNHGEAERLLTIHRPSADGRCVGCGHSMTRWSCVLVAIARAAQDLVAGAHGQGRALMVHLRSGSTDESRSTGRSQPP